MTGVPHDVVNDLFAKCTNAIGRTWMCTKNFLRIRSKRRSHENVQFDKRRFGFVSLFCFVLVVKGGRYWKGHHIFRYEQRHDIQLRSTRHTIICGPPWNEDNVLINWCLHDDQNALQKLRFGFPKCIDFVARISQSLYHRVNWEDWSKLYMGHHHIYCLAGLVWTNIMGAIILLARILMGFRHDCSTYNDCNPYTQPENYIFSGELVLANLSFVGAGDHIAFPFKPVESTALKYQKLTASSSVSKGSLKNSP